MTPKQKDQFNSMLAALRLIATGYQSPEQLREEAEQVYGMTGDEAIDGDHSYCMLLAITNGSAECESLSARNHSSSDGATKQADKALSDADAKAASDPYFKTETVAAVEGHEYKFQTEGTHTAKPYMADMEIVQKAAKAFEWYFINGGYQYGVSERANASQWFEAGYHKALEEENHPQVCCTDWANCRHPCIPRAKYWKERAESYKQDIPVWDRNISEFTIEADPLRASLYERIHALEERALEDYSAWLNIAHDLGANDGDNCLDFILMRAHQAIESIRLILPLAKGYSAAHPLRINDDVVAHAEGFLESLRLGEERKAQLLYEAVSIDHYSGHD